MVIQIATLGLSESVVREGVRIYGAEKIIIVAGESINKVIPENQVKKDKELKSPVELANKLKKDLALALNIEVNIEKVNPFDFQDCLIKLIQILRGIPKNKDKILNLTGGTNIMSGAAVCAAWIEGVKAFYLREKREAAEGEVVIEIPNLKDKKITEKENEILLYLLEREKDEERIASKVAAGVKVRPNTLTTHLTNLINKGLVETSPYTKTIQIKKYNTIKNKVTENKKIKVLKLTDAGNFYANLAKWEKIGFGRIL
jgi:hypothetical protein